MKKNPKLEAARIAGQAKALAALRQAVVFRGVSHKDIAESLGCARVTVTRALQGQQPLSITMLQRICDALDFELTISIREET